MKKILTCLLAGIMVLGMVACSNNTPATVDPTDPPATSEPTTPPATEEPEATEQPETSDVLSGTLEEIMEQVYSGIKDIELPRVENIAINEENIEYYLGTSDIKYVEALASEAMINAIAHSVVLVRVDEDADVEDVKTKIKENVDGSKWICVGVADDKIVVDNIGNLVILIMDDQSEFIHESFLALAK
jgi:hypothetical protein